MELYIVIGIFLFMIVSFCLNEWPFGLTTMTCCILLVVTGIMPIEEAFSGFAMKNFVLIAGMYVLCDAFSKTSLLASIRNKVLSMQGGKNNILLLLLLMTLSMCFAQFLSASANITVMMILLALSPDGEVCPSRMLLPMAVMGGMWTSRIPIGMGATAHLQPNKYIASYGDTLPLLTITDTVKVSILPMIALSVATAVAAGWNPRGLCLLVNTVCSCAAFLPSGAPSTAIAFAAGGYKFQETFLWALGFSVITIVTFVFSINFFFPVF